MFDFVLFNKTGRKGYDVNFFKKVLVFCFKESGLENQKFGLSINLVRPSVIKSLNNKYRRKNQVTDVLSFPLNHKKIYSDKTKIDSKTIELGDIFICPAEARKRSLLNTLNLNQEIKFLTVHGLLHLLGYDHEKSYKERSKMLSIQSKILFKIKSWHKI